MKTKKQIKKELKRKRRSLKLNNFVNKVMVAVDMLPMAFIGIGACLAAFGTLMAVAGVGIVGTISYANQVSDAFGSEEVKDVFNDVINWGKNIFVKPFTKKIKQNNEKIAIINDKFESNDFTENLETNSEEKITESTFDKIQTKAIEKEPSKISTKKHFGLNKSKNKEIIKE